MNLQTVISTISEANQTAVPSLIRKKLDLEPGDKLLWELESGSKSVKLTPAPKQWGKYMRGLGKQVWKNTDTESYIHKLRQDRKT